MKNIDTLISFLEYIPGGSIAGFLRKYGKFDDQITRSFTGQIMDSLAYLHKNGIIHRVSRVCAYGQLFSMTYVLVESQSE